MKREEEIEERRQIHQLEYEDEMQGLFMQFMQRMMQYNSYPKHSSAEYDQMNKSIFNTLKWKWCCMI